ncbi:MAG: VTT domain-containing protein [Oscillochloris sp.]|nr:VTT domain-containing protein [Oscillochloris sp.]
MTQERQFTSPPPQRWWRLIVIGILLTLVNIAVYVLIPPQVLEQLGSFGYLGAFGSAALANATVLVPVPYYPLLLRLSQSFNPFGVGLAAAAGSVIGELTAYYVGRSGRGVFARTRFYTWVHRQLSHPWRAPFALFMLSAPPTPLFDVAGLLAGALGIRLWIFMLATFLGRLVRMAIVVLFGIAIG